MGDQRSSLAWRAEGVPVSTRFDDPYYSLEDGLAETRHVFLEGNDLPGRFRDGFHIAELGFGTGLSALVAAWAWRESGQAGQMHFTSFEAFPLEKDEMRQALCMFPMLEPAVLLDAWGNDEIQLADNVRLRLVIGDARETVPEWRGRADAWFLDGFSPAKNPELWEPGLMKAVFDQTASQGTFATYTAAGAVRRALSDAGFEVERVKGFGRKRHMTRGRRI